MQDTWEAENIFSLDNNINIRKKQIWIVEE